MVSELISNSELQSYIDDFTKDNEMRELLKKRYINASLIDDLCIYYGYYQTYGSRGGRAKIIELFGKFEDFVSDKRKTT